MHHVRQKGGKFSTVEPFNLWCLFWDNLEFYHKNEVPQRKQQSCIIPWYKPQYKKIRYQLMGSDFVGAIIWYLFDPMLLNIDTWICFYHQEVDIFRYGWYWELCSDSSVSCVYEKHLEVNRTEINSIMQLGYFLFGLHPSTVFPRPWSLVRETCYCKQLVQFSL